jgi:hypothetical protein
VVEGEYCAHMYANAKMIPVETIHGMGENKRKWWRG